MPNGFRLAYQGFEMPVQVYTETEAAAARLMPVGSQADTGKKVLCPMPGLVVSIAVTEGQEVKAGETLAVIEAMKMQNVLRAERDGTVKKIACGGRRDAGGRCTHPRIRMRLLMVPKQKREAFRAILSGHDVIRPGSVYDPISARIAEDLGFELGLLGGSAASLTILGDPDLLLITLSELAEQVRRICRAGNIPVLVDADHGYGNALNVRRTVQELEAAGVAGLTIEDTLLPQAYGQAKPQLISLEEGVGKMKAALDGRLDPSLVIVGRTGAASITNIDDAVARAKAYEAAGVDALFFTGVKTRAELHAIASATTLPIILGSFDGELSDTVFLGIQRVRVANQGHAPIAAATQAVYETLKSLRDGVCAERVEGAAVGGFDQSRDA